MMSNRTTDPRASDSLRCLVAAPTEEVTRAKSIIGDDVRTMLRLTRLLLRPSSDMDAAAVALDGVMKPLAAKIREAANPEAMRAAIDEITLEELRDRYGREPKTQPYDTRKSDQS